MSILNTNLLKCSNDRELRMFFHLFTPDIYNELDILCKLRIENLVKESINLGEYTYTSPGACNNAGSLGIWIKDKLDMFETKYEIIKILQSKLGKSEKEQDYVFYYFENLVFDSSLPLNQILSNAIHRGLKGKNSFEESSIRYYGIRR